MLRWRRARRNLRQGGRLCPANVRRAFCAVRRWEAGAWAFPGWSERTSGLPNAWRQKVLAHSQWPLTVALSGHLSRPFAAASGSCPTPFTHPSICPFCHLLTHSTKHLSSSDMCQRWQLVPDSSLVFPACESQMLGLISFPGIIRIKC